MLIKTSPPGIRRFHEDISFHWSKNRGTSENVKIFVCVKDQLKRKHIWKPYSVIFQCHDFWLMVSESLRLTLAPAASMSKGHHTPWAQMRVLEVLAKTGQRKVQGEKCTTYSLCAPSVHSWLIRYGIKQEGKLVCRLGGGAMWRMHGLHLDQFAVQCCKLTIPGVLH